MVSYTRPRNAYLYFVCIGLALFLLLLAGCGTGDQPATNTSSSTSSTGGTAPKVPAATATAQAIIQTITVVGQPTSKLVAGTTFEVSGQLQNGSDKQHDITIQVSLLDATGKTIATASKLLDNVKGGQTVAFTVQGNTPQATWSSVQVTVTKVSENIGGSGDD